ncbi:hypothetical protein QP572_02405 [Brevibacterium sp. UMB10442]|nr:hypothetical protein [Brevibacterium sp. UMB10442]
MTEYVNDIENYVRKFAPSKYSQIEDPENYFQDLAQEREELIDQLVAQIPYAPPTDEQLKDPLRFMGEHQRERQRIREIAQQTVVYDRFPPEVGESGKPL